MYPRLNDEKKRKYFLKYILIIRFSGGAVPSNAEVPRIPFVSYRPSVHCCVNLPYSNPS